MAITEMKSKISSIENKDMAGLRQSQQHADLLLKDMERRVAEAEEAIKRTHVHIAAENNVLHTLVSDSGSRQVGVIAEVCKGIKRNVFVIVTGTAAGRRAGCTGRADEHGRAACCRRSSGQSRSG